MSSAPEYEAALEGDLTRLRRAAAALAPSFGVRLLVAIGSYGQGLAVYARRPGDSRLRAESDLDLLAIVDRPVRRAALPKLARRLSRETGLPAWVSAMTPDEMARREPAQLWWEAAWRNRVLCGDTSLLAALDVFRDYVPDAADAWRLVLNRWAALVLRAPEQHVAAALKAVRAAIDATLLVRGGLPADPGGRSERALRLGGDWQEAASAYRRFVECPIIEPLDSAGADRLARLAVASLQRAARGLPPRASTTKPVRYRRPEIDRHVRLLAHAAWIPGWPVEEAVLGRLEAALRDASHPPARTLRAWQLLQH